MGLFSFSDKFANFGSTPVDNQFLVEFMPGATGDEVKVYLYGLFACTCQQPDMSLQQMAHDLGLTLEDVTKAYRHWERVGLVERIGDNPPAYRYIPANQAVFMGGSAPLDLNYERFSEAVYAVFGNDTRIHGNEIVKYYEWVVELGLPQEVVLMLLRHMISIRGKKFSFRSADKLASELASSGVRTIEDAEIALTRNRKALECARAVVRKFNMRREPTEPETELCVKWLVDLGFTQEAVLAACEDTTAASAPSFKYLDSILEKRKKGEGGKISGEAYARIREDEAARREPLKKVYEALGRGANAVNEGTLTVYWDLRKIFDDEQVILLAAKELSKRNGVLEDVVKMVTSWKKRGISNADEARAYIDAFNHEKMLLSALGEVWGVRAPAGEANHALVKKWYSAGMTDTFITHVALSAKGEGNPMRYLDAVLERLSKDGIRTPEAADADLARHAAQSVKGKGGKQVTENNYEQRENTERSGEDVPQWLLDRQEEMRKRETGDTQPAADGV